MRGAPSGYKPVLLSDSRHVKEPRAKSRGDSNPKTKRLQHSKSSTNFSNAHLLEEYARRNHDKILEKELRAVKEGNLQRSKNKHV